MITKIGNYELGQTLDYSALNEYSKEDFRKGYGSRITEEDVKNFKFEKVYYGKDIIFLDLNWRIWVFTIGDKISGIDASRKASSKEESNFLFKKLLQYCEEKMGKHTKKDFFNNIFVWDWKEVRVTVTKDKLLAGNSEVAIGIEWNKFFELERQMYLKK